MKSQCKICDTASKQKRKMKTMVNADTYITP